MALSSITIGDGWNMVDLSYWDNRLTYANYKHLDVELIDQNAVGVNAIATPIMINGWWHLGLYSNAAAYISIQVNAHN